MAHTLYRAEQVDTNVNNKPKITRRNFLKGLLSVAIVAPLVSRVELAQAATVASPPKPTVLLSSKRVLRVKPSSHDWLFVSEVEAMEKLYPEMLKSWDEWEREFAQYLVTTYPEYVIRT